MPDDAVELFVPARERACVARALLAAAAQQGLPAEVVRTTSYGYRVPRPVADAADVDLARQAAAAGEPPPGMQTYAGHRPGGRVQYSRDLTPDAAADDPDPEPVEVELPAPVQTRRRGGRK